MLTNLLDLFPLVRASTADKQLLARYIAQRPALRQSMKKAPPSPLSWWGLLRQAEINAGIRRYPPLRAA